MSMAWEAVVGKDSAESSGSYDTEDFGHSPRGSRELRDGFSRRVK